LGLREEGSDSLSSELFIIVLRLLISGEGSRRSFRDWPLKEEKRKSEGRKKKKDKKRIRHLVYIVYLYLTRV